ncbi:mitochondrial distribution and morphology protein [Hirsutella rhossiliensis]|uniref:Mitochondrial distribution and morphology protein 10 n=1 Tax=Hirsutella rhossiliensis TaxID=111463 RepID=A0A9P8MPL4_9HYPO|nr:mitochondrial distribution and morphology protein [Hirsutella rhossiliensis]KAH0959968.1 mitochondrial distribution and morphology protein [Hirsutella rhossiliensis]
MREFMDHVHATFYEATGWSRDNSYAALNAIPDALLNFQTPRGLRLTLSSLASPNFATSYQLGSVGVVDGSISYLYSSVALRDVHLTPRSDTVSLPRLLRSYRPLSPLPPRCNDGTNLRGASSSSSLLCGRLYLPLSQLEALAVRRVSPALQLQLSAVSAQHLRDGGTLLGLAQYDTAKYSFEGLASSDGGLLGLRGIYNFGGDVDEASNAAAAAAATTNNTCATGKTDDRERIYGRFSTGAEIYYGTLNKSGGISLGGRFATLPEHKGTPLSATLTLNPLMGNISASYAVVAGRHCSLATRMEFNVFSYESAWAVGMELWRKPFRRPVAAMEEEEGGTEEERRKRRRRRRRPGERSWQAKLDWRLDDEHDASSPSTASAAGKAEGASAAWAMRQDGGAADEKSEYAGVLKARLDQNLRIGVLWEGRVKSLLFSLGSGIDLRKLDKPFRTLGLEIQFSS